MDTDNVSSLNSEFNAAAAKEWYYETFKKSAEWLSSPLHGKKLPDWKNGIYKKIGTMEIVEFPLVTAKKTIMIPSGSSLSTADKKRITEASLIKIAFIHKNNKVEVRETDYIPDLSYLQKHNYDISNASLLNINNDFSGQIVIKDWKGSIVSIRLMQNGKITKNVKIKTGDKSTINSIQSNAAKVSDCDEDMWECMFELWCDVTTYGDGMQVIDNCEWINTGVCWPAESNCPPDPCDGLNDEECACLFYGICGGADDDPPPQQDPCAEAQPGADKAKALSQNSNYTSGKTAVQTAASSDGNEHAISFGKDANGNIITSSISTGNDHTGTVGSVTNQFADLHNHQGVLPPSSGDLYGFIDLASGSNLYETRYIVTANGAVYALIVTDLEAAKKFNTDHPRVPSPGYEPDFPDSLVNEFDRMKGWGGATDEMALAFILEKYHAGVALLKQDSNGNFKRLNTKETSDANENKTYTATNCQ